MEQLLSMGFSHELAAQALAATGGQSTLKATEWILSFKSATPIPNHPSCHVQPKLDRFFQLQSKPSSSINNSPPAPIANAKHREGEENEVPPLQEESEESIPYPTPSKRPKVMASSTSNSPSPPLLHPTNTKLKPIIKPHLPPHEPLSERMRPRTIDDVVGQDHLLSHNSLLRSAINSNHLPSIILWGPPGTGKTSLAKSIVNSLPPTLQAQFSPLSYRFVSLSAVTCGIKDVRDAVEGARSLLKANNGKRTVLFVDEVHRFNKSQQDSFLPVIEDGSIVFMGATTENPSFHLITPLLSRCRVLTLAPLNPPHVLTILTRAINDTVKGLRRSVGVGIDVREDAIQFLSLNCDGDARVALNALEISAITAAARMNPVPDGNSSLAEEAVAIVNLEDAKEALQCKHLAYDKAGEEHYNLISALHKSMRGNDADASIYWLARMLEGGEQPLYIARRLIRFASEDVGLADPLALNQAVACYQACHFLGMPECNVILAQCVAYLALAPKSISVYRAIEAAQKVVRESVGQNQGVPLHLRNAPTKLMKELGYGKGYIYTPDEPSSVQSYLPSSLQGFKFLDWPPTNTNNG